MFHLLKITQKVPIEGQFFFMVHSLYNALFKGHCCFLKHNI